MKRSIRLLLVFLSTVLVSGALIEADPITEITEKFNAHNKAFPQVKLHLVFNQPGYAPGDTAFFKAYLLSDNLIPVKGRQIMDLVLLDEQGKEILRNKYRIDDGTTSNQTIIPAALNSGVYRIVAYTNWMKNFSSKLYFNSLLNVSGENCYQYPADIATKIELFPEGGNLVANIPTRVVALATRNGIPVSGSGKVVDQNGNEIHQFVCDENGLASFELKLEAEKRYRIEFGSGGSSELIVAQDGYSLAVTDNGELIKATIGLQSRRETNESITVILTSRSQIRYASMISVSSASPSSVLIPIRNLPTGIAQLSIFDSKTKLLGSRLIFIPVQNETVVDLRLDRQIAPTRSSVGFDLDIKDPYGASKAADIVVSGYLRDLFPKAELVEFNEELLIASDIPDSRPLLKQIDITSNEGVLALDNFLITRNWERFNWNDVLSNKKKEAEFLAEGTLIYNGVASFVDNGKPVPDSTLVLLFLQERTFGYEVYTSDNGLLKWPVYFDFYGNENIMYSMESRGKRLQNASIKLVEDSLPGFAAPEMAIGKQRDPYYSFSNISKVVSNSFAYSWNKSEVLKTTSNPNAPMEDELNGVDATINVDDYVVFPTMEDLFREVVRFVQNKKVGGKPTLRVLSTDSNNPITGDPLCIVDGIATRNIDFIMGLKPGDIAVIKVVNDARKLRNLGSITKNGVIFFQTKIADISTIIPKNDILYVDGLVKPASFTIANPTERKSRTPSFKSTVFWKTQIDRNERGLMSGTIFTPDNTGKINVRVQGITSDGIPFDKIQMVEVNFQQPN